jgi:hypothetical protein
MIAMMLVLQFLDQKKTNDARFLTLLVKLMTIAQNDIIVIIEFARQDKLLQTANILEVI